MILAALLRDSATRRLLGHPRLDILLPTDSLPEIDRNPSELAHRAGVPIITFQTVLSSLLAHVRVVPAARYDAMLDEALRILRHIDPSDAPFLALAMAEAVPIWSNDGGLRRQDRVPVVTTRDVVIPLWPR